MKTHTGGTLARRPVVIGNWNWTGKRSSIIKNPTEGV